MNMPKFAVYRGTITIAVSAVLMLVGIQVFFNMPRREDPEIVVRQANLLTLWPGAPAEKMEQLITRPLELAIKEVAEIKEIKSDSRVGVSSIVIETIDEVQEIDVIWSKIRAKIDLVKTSLPSGAQAPNLNTDFGDVSAMVFAVYQVPWGKEKKITRPYSMRELDDMLKDIEDALQEIPMVGKIEKFGLQKEVIYLETDAQDWGQLSISSKELASILDSRNIIAPGGTISTNNKEFSVKPSGEFITPSQIQSVVIGVNGDIPVHLKSINLAVSRRYEEPPLVSTQYFSPESGRTSCVVISFSMRSGYNIVKMGELVRKKLALISQSLLPPDLKIKIICDTPTLVNSSISDFLSNLWQAVVIVLLVALVMIGWRASLIMATAIPLTMISVFVFMPIFKVELEQMSIASLIIALGMLVDNAIVISDNILRHIRMGLSRKEAAWKGTMELSVPVFTSTLTTVAAFLPMLLIPSGGGEYIRSLPIVVSATLLTSFFVAMTITPFMSSLMLKETEEGSFVSAEENQKVITTGLMGYYGKFITWCLDHKGITLTTITLVFLGSLLLVPIIGSAFFPKGIRNQFVIDVNLPAGSSIEQTTQVVRTLEEILLSESKEKEGEGEKEGEHRLKNTLSYIGKGGPRFYISLNQENQRPYYAQMVVSTTSKWKTAAYVKAFSERIAREVSGAEILIRTLDMGPPLTYPLVVRAKGNNVEELYSIAKKIEAQMREEPGTLNVHNSWGSKSYQLSVDIDEETANLAGVNNLEVAKTLYGYFSGMPLTSYREGRHTIDVVLRVKPEQRQSLKYLDGLYVEGKNGKIPINAVAKVYPTWQMAKISRRDLIRTIEVRARVADGYLSNNVMRNLISRMNKLSLSPGYKLEIGGEYEETQESQANMSHSLSISLLLIILVLIIQFNSFLKPLIILLTVPLALIGAFLGLLISGWPLGFMPMLGIVSLAGVVVNNAIVLIEFIENALLQGVGLRTAVVSSGQLRMRPILLTTFTTVGGFIPLALSGGPLWEGMAYVIIFGLLVSTVLTLVIVPTLFTLFAENFGMKTRPKDG